MPNAENFIAVDWRSGGDKCYFFFKDRHEYYRFDNDANHLSPDYPKPVSQEHWGELHQHLKNFRFGFATDKITTMTSGETNAAVLWLFYYDGTTPMFCEYDQSVDRARGVHTVAGSIWASLLPYFDRIIAGTWWERPDRSSGRSRFRFLLNDGNALDLNWHTRKINLHPIDEDTWPGLAPYKDRMITAVQMYSDTGDSLYYIFLTNQEYLKYNISNNRLMVGAISVYGAKRWPGLFEERELEDFVAVDWRSGKDRYYFFFKKNNTYSRFDIGDNRIAEGFPSAITFDNWHDFHPHAKNLRFGFTTTHIMKEQGDPFDQDFLWLFYYDSHTPMVCQYDQDTDTVRKITTVEKSYWKVLLPHFHNIITGTWWGNLGHLIGKATPFRFLMKNGESLQVEFHLPNKPRLRVDPINNTTWPGLEPYKHRIITAVQNDRTLIDSLYYIFLTHNEYLIYDMPDNRLIDGPLKINDFTWPGLLQH